MNQLRLPLRHGTAVAALTSTPARRVLAVAAFATLTALSARASVPLGAVPVSLQTLAVLLSGLLLGPALGAAAQVSYLAAGAVGLPVFVGGAGLAYLFGPTGGFLIAFPAAAAAAGAIATGFRRSDRLQQVLVYAAAAVVATLLVYLGGWAQLAALTGDAVRALRLGVLPFLIGDALKILIAVAVADRLRRAPVLE